MPQSHIGPMDLDTGSGTTAYWSSQPKGTLILFVHGFGGSATGTWLEFPGLLLAEPKANNVDLVFFGYDGLRTRATNTAVVFEKFLNRVFTSAPSLINQSLPASLQRAPSFSYRKVILVGHSLGAVVVRQALVDAHLRKRAWAPKVSMVLFAPAHSGSNLLRLIASAASGLSLELPFVSISGQVAVDAAKLKLRVLQDLEPGCDTLNKLLEDTQKALEGGNADFLKPAKVLHSDLDDVVNPVRFADDPPHDLIQNKDHSEMCKPRRDFVDPLITVLGEV